MLDGINLFSNLSKESLSTLEMFCQERSLKQGEILFTKGEQANSFYIVKKGLLEAIDDGTSLGFIKPGEIAGEMGLFNIPKVRMASVKAIKESNLIVLLDFSIKQLGEKYPNILIEIQNIIKQRDEINKRVK